MKRSPLILQRSAGNAVAVALVLVAFTLSVVRFWLLPQAANHRPELARQIGRLIDENVQIGSVSAHMRGFHPELIFDDFRIVDARGLAGVRFDQVRVGIHLLKSLFLGRLAPIWVNIHGTRLAVRRQMDGTLAVLGLTIIDHPPAWLLAAEYIELLDSHLDWQDEQRGSPLVDLGRADLRLSNLADRHQLTLSCRGCGGEEGGLELRADLHGDLFRQHGWGGRIYLEGRALSASSLVGLLPAASWLRSGQSGFRVWSDWAEGRMNRIAGWAESKKSTVILPTESGAEVPLTFAAAESWFRWRESDRTSLLELSGLRMTPNGAPGLAARISFELERDDSGRMVSWRSTASRVSLDDFTALSTGLPMVPDAARRLLRNFSPTGELRDLRVVYRPSAEEGRRFLFCADLTRLGFRAWHALPGLSEVSGRICGREGAGSLHLRAAKSELEFPAVFRTPLKVQSGKLAAQWDRTDGVLRIESKVLSLDTPDFFAEGAFRFDLADDPVVAPVLDFRGTVSDLSVPGLKRYLPYPLLPRASRYLESALVGGRIARADVLFRGPLPEYSFDDQRGVFEALLDLRKIDFLYRPGWPPVQGVDARLRFSGAAMELDAGAGRIGNGEIVSIKGSIPDLQHAPVLSLDGEVRASIVDTMDFMASSPLRSIPERLLQFLTPVGETDIRMHFAVPIGAKAGDIRVEGTASLKNAHLAFRDVDASVETLGGTLHFTEAGLSASDLSGLLLDQPVHIAATTKGDATEINAAGRAAIPGLERVFPSELWRFVRGAGTYNFALSIPDSAAGAGPSLAWVLKSDLRGVQLDLPEPLTKAVDVPGDLEVAGRVEPGNRIPLRLSYDEKLRVSLTLARVNGLWTPDRGTIAWGRDFPRDHGSGGFGFYGRFLRFDVAAWERFAARLGSSEGVGSWRENWREVEFEARELLWSGWNFGAFRLKVKHTAPRWTGSIEGDVGHGKFLLAPGRNGYQAMHLDLDSLQIPRDIKPAISKGKMGALDSRAFPSLYLRCRKVLWKGVDVGALILDAERQSLGLVLSKGELTGARHRLNFSGDWLSSAGKNKTRLSGQARVDSLGELATELGHPAKIQDTRATVEFQLNWPGSPLEVTLPALQGEIGARMEEGALLEYEPGWGRVIGFLNLHSIWRRITLDFRDLLNKGLAYDLIEGRFKLDGGQARTQGFLIDGVATRIVIDGSADLKAETLNQIVTVIPRTSVALPIAGTLAGGPAVGAAIFVAQELVGEHVDSITATRYKVTGPWGDPTINKVEGNMPLELLDRAWSGLKNLSGSGKEPKEGKR